MAKRVATIIALVLLLGGGAACYYRDFLLSSTLRYFVQWQCRDLFGSPLQCDSFVVAGGHVVVEEPLFQDTSSDPEGGYRIHAEQLILDIDYHDFPWNWRFFSKWVKPHILVVKKKETLPPCRLIEALTSTCLPWEGRVVLEKGSMQLVDETGSGDPDITLFLDLDLSGIQELAGTCAVRLAEGNVDAALSMQVQPTRRGQAVSLSMNDMPCATAARVARFFNVLQGWQVGEGIARGGVEFEIDSNAGFVSLQGDIDALHLNFSHSGMPLHGDAREVHLHLHHGFAGDVTASLEIELSGQSRLCFSRDEVPFWEVDDLSGCLSYKSSDLFQLVLCGHVQREGMRANLAIRGESRNVLDQISLFSLNAQLTGGARNITKARLTSYQTTEGPVQVDVELDQVAAPECQVIQSLLSSLSPDWNAVRFREGTLSATVHCILHQQTLRDLRVENVACHQVALEFPAWDLTVKAREACGSLGVNFSSPDPWRTLQADLALQEGSGSLARPSRTPWVFQEVQANFMVRQGVVHKSLITGNFAGLRGRVDLDWSSSQEVMRLHGEGPISDALSLLPIYFDHSLPVRDTLIVDAAATRETLGDLRVKGNLALNRGCKTVPLQFGFALRQATGMRLEEGWFECKNLPLEDYLSPLIFAAGDFHLSGVASCRGAFDQDLITVRYNAQRVTLEGESFRIEVPEIQGDSQEQIANDADAVHVFDLAKGRHAGVFNVCRGSYLQKNTSLLFEKVESQVRLNNDEIRIDQIDTTCEGLHFQGSMSVDNSNPDHGYYDIYLHVKSAEGSLLACQRFASHFEAPTALCRWPLAGKLKAWDGELVFTCTPDTTTVDLLGQGSLSEVSLALNDRMDVRDLGFDFSYSKKEQLLEIRGFRSLLGVGGADSSLFYECKVDNSLTIPLSLPIFDFEATVQGPNSDLTKVAGTVRPILSSLLTPQICVCFNGPQCRFCGGSVDNSTLVFSKDGDLQRGNAHLQVPLRSAAAAITSFGNAFWKWGPPWSNLEEQVAGRDLCIDLSFCADQGLFSFAVMDEECLFCNRSLGHFKICGTRRQGQWHLEEMLLDNTVSKAEIAETPEGYSIRSLSSSHPSLGSLSLQGNYQSISGALNACVDVMDVNVLEILSYAGVNVRDFSKDYSISLQDVRGASLSYQADRGFVVHSVKTALLSERDQRIDLQADTVSYNPFTRHLSLKGLAYAVPGNRVEGLLQAASHLFPWLKETRITDVVKRLRQDCVLTGSLDVELAPSTWQVKVSVDESTYQLFDSEHRLKDFQLRCDGKQVRAVTHYNLWNRSYGLFFVCALPTEENKNCAGILAIMPHLEEETAQALLSGSASLQQMESIVVSLQWTPEKGFSIPYIQGGFCGLRIQVYGEEGEFGQAYEAWKGAVEVDFSLATLALPQSIAAWASRCGLGSGYRLEGTWWVPRQCWQEMIFKGRLLGQNFSVKGVLLDSMVAEVDYRPGGLRVSQLNIQDHAGFLDIPLIVIDRSDDASWWINIPTARIEDFRPRSLRPRAYGNKKTKLLVIDELQLNNITGCLDDSQTLIGYGRLHFVNGSKKGIEHPLLAIPSHLISRIGLDPHVFQPLDGEIVYQIRDGKIWLTEFKDVRSKGGLSRFYLPTPQTASYVDFNGNLNVKVRMKQNNLVFKLAELFTVTVHGTLNHPTYSIQKQSEGIEELVQVGE